MNSTAEKTDHMVFTAGHPGRLAGGLLVLSFLIGLGAAFILFASGAGSAFASGLRGGLAQQAPYAGVFRLTNGLYAVMWIILLAGFSLLAGLLLRAGSDQLPILGLTLLGVAAVLGVLEGTFHMGVTTWAAGETAAAGSTPAIYPVLRGWVSSFKLICEGLAQLSLLIFGLAILRSDLLPAGTGWLAAGWGGFWFLALVVSHFGFPALAFIVPPVIGVALWQL